MQGNPTIAKFILICIGFLFALFPAQATHILGGEITYTTNPANPLKIHVRLVVYTDFASTTADNPYALIGFGDGSSEELERKSRNIAVKNKVYKNSYETTHTYPAPGIYQLNYREQNRSVNIVNIANPQDQAFVIITQVHIDPFWVNNNSARFLTAPLVEASLAADNTHHLGAYDPDGDSLTFELVPALQVFGQPANGYFLPDFIKMNKQTGEITWNKPQVAGQYSFAAKISEYRNKRLVGYVLRDFTVLVRDFSFTFNQSLAITNRAELGITPQNQVYIAPNQSVKINALLNDTGVDSIRLEVFSDLFEQGDELTVTQTNTGNAAPAELNLVAAPVLKRDTPYLIVLRGHSFKGAEIYNQEVGLQVFINSETTTSINKPVQREPFLVYPNPAEAYIVIQHPNLKKNTWLWVYNDTGKLIWRQKLTANATNIRRSQVAGTGKFVYAIAEDQQIIKTGQFIFK